MAHLTIVRGLPGSGKSTFARRLQKELGLRHYEADMFHINEDGEYKFNPSKIAESHAWCQHMVYSTLLKGYDVVVSNTFTQLWEMVSYMDLTEAMGVSVEVIETKEMYGNIHNVPENIMEAMKARWEDYELDKTSYKHIVGVATVEEKERLLFQISMKKIRHKMLEAGGKVCPHCQTMWEDDYEVAVCPCLER